MKMQGSITTPGSIALAQAQAQAQAPAKTPLTGQVSTVVTTATTTTTVAKTAVAPVGRVSFKKDVPVSLCFHALAGSTWRRFGISDCNCCFAIFNAFRVVLHLQPVLALTTVTACPCHVIRIWVIDNWCIFTTVAVSQGHVTAFCNFPSRLLTDTANGGNRIPLMIV